MVIVEPLFEMNLLTHIWRILDANTTLVAQFPKYVKLAEIAMVHVPVNEGSVQRGLSFGELVASTIDVHNEDTHYSLRGDLIEYLWSMKGSNNHA
jgi:hypothetical protein